MERLEIAGHELLALSVGGLETCHYFPRLKLAFDIGRCPEEVVNCPTVLFTHAHMDHMGGVAYHTATRALRMRLHAHSPTLTVDQLQASGHERVRVLHRA